jgi:hypothetical protein
MARQASCLNPLTAVVSLEDSLLMMLLALCCWWISGGGTVIQGTIRNRGMSTRGPGIDAYGLVCDAFTIAKTGSWSTSHRHPKFIGKSLPSYINIHNAVFLCCITCMSHSEASSFLSCWNSFYIQIPCPIQFIHILYYYDQVFSHRSQATMNWVLEVFCHRSWTLDMVDFWNIWRRYDLFR